MSQINRVALVVLLSLCPGIVAAQAVTRITRAEIDGHLRFLSSDLLEGRAPATRAAGVPAWNRDAEFRSPRPAAQP